MKKTLLFSATALACTMFMASCDPEEEVNVKLTDITVVPAEIHLVVGNSQKVTATPVPDNATGVAFEWSSADTTIATVSDGTITAVKVGNTTVTVKSGSVSKAIPVEALSSEVALVSIAVPEDQKAIDLPVDDTVMVSATPVPSNATGVTLGWSSADSTIATVSQTGKITITGVGSTTVTVSSGTVKTEIAVRGRLKSVKVVDPDGNSAGSAYPGGTVQLSVELDPATEGLTPSWASNNTGIADVDASGLITLTSAEGIATITATVDGVEGAYTISTDKSPLDEAYGYWQFDDSTNLGKATKGSDLTVNGTVTVVEGPSAANLAVEGTQGERNLEWNHQTNTPEQFTMMFDVRFVNVGHKYYALYWNGDQGDASFFARWRADDGGHTNTLQMGKGGYIHVATVEEGGTSPWLRVIITVELTPSDGQAHVVLYVDGEMIRDDNMGDYFRLHWTTGYPVYFAADNDGEDNPHPIAAIAAWDRLLSEQEIALLGGVK